MMHIAVEASRLAKDQRGIGRYTRKLVSGLARLDAGLSFTLYAKSSDIRAVRSELDALGISPERCDVQSVGRVRRARFDLFWSPWNVTKYLPRAGPIVVTIHDVVPLVFADRRWRRVLRRRKVERRFRLMASAADLIVADSIFTQTELQRWLEVPPERVRVVPLGVDGFSPGDPAVVTQAQELGVQRPYLLHVGSGEVRKNLARLIRAVGLLRNRDRVDCRLLLAGPKDILRPASFDHVIKEAGMVNAVEYAFGVDDARLQTLYRAAKALVFPSLYEGFGLPVLEAMASGTPVVTSNTTSIPEVAGDAALYFDPENTEEMAEQLRRAVTDEQLRGELIARGLAQAARFRWEDTAQRTLEIFRSLVDGRRHVAPVNSS
jgi:glycosyltransferase involved in cell wall biosynthesis